MDLLINAGALRQYRHNDNSGFVFGYDKEITEKVLTLFIQTAEQFKRAYKQEVLKNIQKDKAMVALEDWIREEGIRSNVCTQHILKRKCDNCKCDKQLEQETQVFETVVIKRKYAGEYFEDFNYPNGERYVEQETNGD